MSIVRNYRDLESLIEEVSALAVKNTLLQMYNEATKEPYCFWYINLVSKTTEEMFYINFDRKMVMEDN